MSSFEQIIGEALFSGDHELGMARACVKEAVMRQMFCQTCQRVLDQEDAVYFETPLERPAGVLCSGCAEATTKSFPEGIGYIKYSWAGCERVNC